MLILTCGCADGTPDREDAGAPSTCTEELELRIGEFTEEDEPLARLENGDALHLWNAPQGGHVVLVAAEVRGLTGEMVSIEARLLNPSTEELVKDDVRNIVMKPFDAEEGWMTPDIRSRAQVAHIPMCPDEQSRSLLEREFLLEVEIEQMDPCAATGIARALVVPMCSQDAVSEREFCVCQCQPGYEPGQCEL